MCSPLTVGIVAQPLIAGDGKAIYKQGMDYAQGGCFSRIFKAYQFDDRGI